MNNKIKSYVFSFIIGILLLLWNIFSLIKTQEAKTWPTENGKVICSEVIRHGGKGVSYNAKIKFVYIVNGQSYLSDMVSFGEFGFNDSEYADKVVDRYPLNKLVIVHYNPRNPEESILEFNETGIFFYLIVGFLFVFAGLLLRFKYKNSV